MPTGSSLDLLMRMRAEDDGASDTIKKVRSTFSSEVKGMESVGTSAFGKLGASIGLSSSQMATLSKAAPIAGQALQAVVGVITAAVTAAVALGGALFGMAKHASDFGSEILEASQKTNLSTEFVSALKVAADEGGSSLEAISKAATKFGNSAVDAARGNKQLAADLKLFGLDAKTAYLDSEKSLSQFITKFNELPDSTVKNEAAMRLFKDRTGEVIPVLKQIGGNFDDFMQKQREMGRLLTQEGADRADAFGDQLKELSLTAEHVGINFATRFMPQMTNAMADIEEGFLKSQTSVKTWGDVINEAIKNARISWVAMGIYAKDHPIKFNISPALMMVDWDNYDESLRKAREIVDRKDGQRLLDQQINKVRASLSAGDDTEPTAPDEGEAEKRAKAASAAYLENLQTAERAAARARKDGLDNLNKLYAEGNKKREDYIKEAEAIEDAYLKAMEDILGKQRDELRKSIEDKNTLQAKETALDERFNELVRENEKAKQAIRDSANETRLARQQKFNARAEEIAKASDERDLAQTKETEDKKTITHEQAETRRHNIIAAALKRRDDALQKERDAAAGNTAALEDIAHRRQLLDQEREAETQRHNSASRGARKADLDDAQAFAAHLLELQQAIQKNARDLARADLQDIINDGKATKAQKEFARNELEKLDLEELEDRRKHEHSLLTIAEAGLVAQAKSEKDRLAIRAAYAELHRQLDADIDQRARERAGQGGAPAEVDTSFGGNFLGTIGEQLAGLVGVSQQVAQTIGGIGVAGINAAGLLTGALSQMGQALGSVVNSWVFLGNASGQSARKMVASVLASVAAQAAALGAFHFAIGLVALTPFGQALGYGNPAQWFLSAAVMFSIAAGAALGGRLAAGNSFQQGGGAGASASSGTVGRSIAGNSEDEQRTIELGRNRDAGELPPHPEFARVYQQIERLAGKVDTLADRDRRIIIESHTDASSIIKVVGQGFDQLVHNNIQSNGKMRQELVTRSEW